MTNSMRRSRCQWQTAADRAPDPAQFRKHYLLHGNVAQIDDTVKNIAAMLKK